MLGRDKSDIRPVTPDTDEIYLQRSMIWSPAQLLFLSNICSPLGCIVFTSTFEFLLVKMNLEYIRLY